MLTRKNILAIIAIAVLIATAVLPMPARGKSSAAKREKWSTNATKRKADYIFMEAMRQNTLENQDAYFELLRGAYALDSTETSLGQTLGYYYMIFANGEDSIFSARGYDMMRSHFNLHPDDYYSTIFYGMVNNRLGNTRESVRVWQTLDSLKPNNPDVALKYAEALQATLDSANLRRSIDVLNRIERAEGKDLGLSSHKIRAFMTLKDSVGTEKEVRSLIASSSRNSNNTLYVGDVFMALNQPDSAITYYNRACELDSTNGIAYYRRAEFYRERGDSVAFDREVFQAVKQEGLDLEVKLEIFTSYIRQLYTDSVQRPRIQTLFDALLLQHPHEVQTHDLYSSYLIAINDYRGAAEQQEYALDIEPANANRWRSAISMYFQTEDYNKALETADRALSYLPDDPMLTFYRSTALSQLKRDDEAMQALHKALEVTPEVDKELQSSILCAIGDNLYKANNVDSAFVYYDRALEANPDNLLALNNCAYFLAEQGRDLDRAEKMSAICVRQEPDNDTSLDTYAWIFFKKQNYEKAKEIIDRAMALEAADPQSDVLHHAGDIYYMSGDPAQALEFWKQALDLDPENKLLQKKVKNKTHYYE